MSSEACWPKASGLQHGSQFSSSLSVQWDHPCFSLQRPQQPVCPYGEKPSDQGHFAHSRQTLDCSLSWSYVHQSWTVGPRCQGRPGDYGDANTSTCQLFVEIRITLLVSFSEFSIWGWGRGNNLFLERLLSKEVWIISQCR